MEISNVMKELHEQFKKGDKRTGCVDRANVLYYIMRSNGLNPKINLFFFEDDKGKKLVNNHCVIILNGGVYDANIEESQNPIEFNKYKQMKKKEHPKFNMVWLDWETFTSNNIYFIDWLWDYLDNLDEEIQNKVRPLIKDEYEAYMKMVPYLKK